MSLLDEVDSPTKLRALPDEQLPALCAELREEIVAVCGKVGGHLGASLGTVELIVALHKVFKSPVDRIVFDVGHQAYAHKLLTGRRPRMSTLRQAKGVAPFLDPRESEHDAFAAGHACTAVSAALGILEAKRRQDQPGTAVAVVGDGALTGGLTFEGLINAGAWPAPLVVVLNDNQMSISKNVTAVSKMLPTPMARQFFEAMGFSYLGPVDGHDLPKLIDALRTARRAQKPMLVHVHTQKGKGFAEAEADPHTRGHAMGPYEWRDGKLVRSRGGQVTFSEAFSAALENVMAADKKVVAITPAMIEGSALGKVQARFPDRTYDVGIAEQHAATFSGGLAIAGLKPVCLVYSTFLQRSFDQIVHDVCLPNLPVVFAVDRAGLVGADGATHQGAYDVAFLRPIPGMSLFAPVTGDDVEPMLREALALGTPCAIRFPRGTLPSRKLEPSTAPSRWLLRPEAAKANIIASGPLALTALEAAEKAGGVGVLNPRRVWPLDEASVVEAAKTGRLLIAEEGTTRGGLGSAVLETLAKAPVLSRVEVVGLPDVFIPHGDARTQRAELGLDAAGLDRALTELLR